MPKSEPIVVTYYYRVSTKKEAQQTSFKAQPKLFKALIARPEFKNYKAYERFYFDYGVSGTKLDRPGFIEMLEDAGLDVEYEDRDDYPHPDYPDKLMKQRIYIIAINPKKKPKFNEIWVKTTSRLARNINAYEILIALRNAGVFVYFIDSDLTTRKDEDLPAIRKKLDEDMAYSEGLSRGRKIVNSLYEAENALLGCPYGYDRHNVPKKRGAYYTRSIDDVGNEQEYDGAYYTINEHEAEAVRKMFQWCIEGLGVVAIANRLNEEGYRTREGKPFYHTSILKKLNNEKYMGLNTTGKYTTGTFQKKLSYAQIRTDYEDRLKETPYLPAIVSKETFEEAKKAREGRTTNKERGISIPKHPFKDILECAYCHNHFTYDNNGGNGYFQCSTKSNQGINACNCNNLFVHQLETFLTGLEKGDLHKHITLDYEGNIVSLITMLENYLNRLKDPVGSAELQEELSELEKEIIGKRQARDRAIEMLGKTLTSSTLGALTSKIEELDIELQELEKQQQGIIIPQDELRDKIEQFFSVIYEQIELAQNFKTTYTREEILGLVEKISVGGKTKNNSGGLPPKPILIPLFKTTIKSQGLLSMGYKEFRYKYRNGLPDYEAPDHFIQTKRKTIAESVVHPFDTDIPESERRKLLSKETKSKWPVGESKCLLTNDTYLKANGELGYIPNLGVVEEPAINQIKKYVDQLHTEYLSL